MPQIAIISAPDKYKLDCDISTTLVLHIIDF